MAKLSAHEDGSLSPEWGRDELVRTLDTASSSETLNFLSHPSWAERLTRLREGIISCWQADSEVIEAAVGFFTWLTNQVLEKKGLRRDVVLAQARRTFESVAHRGFLGLLARHEFAALFDGRKGASDFVDAMGERLAFWEPEDGFGPKRTHTLRMTTDLLFEIAWFAHNLAPRRASIDAARRTTKTSEGEEYCRLCFRPSHRYRLSHGLPSSARTITGVSSMRVLFTGRPSQRRSPRDIDEIDRACPKHCEEMHSVLGELRDKNRKKRSGTKKGAALLQQPRHGRGSFATQLEHLRLAAPRSIRLERMAEWYQNHPQLAGRELPQRFTEIIDNRPITTAIVKYILSTERCEDIGEGFHLDNGILLLELWRRGQVKAVRYDGTIDSIVHSAIDPGSFSNQFDAFLHRTLGLLQVKNEDLTGFDIALFEQLGLEIALSNNLLRFTFESPDWLSHAIRREVKT